ncbi:CoA transferase [Bradyrhizobium sp. CCGB20]|uniref:CoA transferase n=1 Tax=unclassified Bradyrhizobium TaxID=2631580 RepID=UPI002811E86C|nr:CoA transferase [Bradyrhizobium sp. CCGB20]
MGKCSRDGSVVGSAGRGDWQLGGNQRVRALFADFGADVQKIEPPAGAPLRYCAPFTPVGQSAWFAFLKL